MPNNDKLSSVRKYIREFSKFEEEYRGMMILEIREAHFKAVEDLVDRAARELPGEIPPLDKEQLRGHWAPAFGRLDVALIREWLQRMVAILQSTIDHEKSTEVHEPLDFAFIKDQGLRKVLERDGLETQATLAGGHWKSTIILAGGVLEAILMDRLLYEPSALTAVNAPKKKKNVTEWTLNELILVALELQSVNASVANLSHAVREFRNLVHPGKELREKLVFGKEEARIALEVLKILVRDMAKPPGSKT